MCKESCEDQNWFYVENKRAMVSLGPLNSNKTCPYNCAFCYVQDGFVPYYKKNISEIINFLNRHRTEYEIIYVSGDTDSFAAPRKKAGLSLLRGIAEEIDCDLLFTTRTKFDDEDICYIAEVVKILNQKNKFLFACISITRYSDYVGYLEPHPIPSPQERIQTLKKLHNIGAVTVLALRPFIPVVPINDYLTILRETTGYIDIVLGEVFYFVLDGKIEKRVFAQGIPAEILSELKTEKMDFNSNEEEWSVWKGEEVEKKINEFCKTNNIIFSMRSSTAILKYKKRNLNVEES